MIIFAFKNRELKEKTQDANFSIPIKNPESAIKKRIPDSDSKIGRIPDSGSGLPTLPRIAVFLKIYVCNFRTREYQLFLTETTFCLGLELYKDHR